MKKRIKSLVFTVITLVIILMSNLYSFAQEYTYTSVPSMGTYVSCPNSCSTWTGNTVQMKLISANANNFVFVIRKCSGSFSSAGYFYVGWDTDLTCGYTPYTNGGFDYVYVAANATEVALSVPASWFSNGNKSYWTGVFYSISGAHYYYAGDIDITRTIVCPTPYANFSANQTNGSSPLNVQFSDQSNPGSGQSITNYLWDFGDGYTSTSSNPSHTYYTAGNYTVQLGISNSCGNIDSETKYGFISVSVPCPTPTANFYVNNSSGTAPFNVQFNDQSDAGSGQYISSYSWDFGDYSYSNQQNPSHTYSNAGSYNVSLTVSNSCGNSDNETKYSFISVVQPTAVISLSGDLSFGNVQVGTTSIARTLTITNNGNSTLTVNSISFPTGFSGSWSGNIPAGQNQQVSVTFLPTQATTYSGYVTVNSNATSGTNTIAISGTGTPVPTAIISLAGNLSFGSVQVGTTSTPQVLTITNNGTATLTVNSITYPTGFSGSWNGNIAAGQNQQVNVIFSPTQAMPYNGTVSVNSNSTGGTSTIAISGTGTPEPTAIISLAGDLSFGSVQVGTTSTPQVLTITNNGNATLTVNSITYPTGFSGSWNGNIAAGQNQQVNVIFSPTQAMPYNGTVSVNSNSTGGTSTIAISGTGTPAPTAIISLAGDLSFGNVQVGSTSDPRVLTITNNGNSTLTVNSISYPNGFSGSWSGNISAGQNQQINVVFTPILITYYPGIVTVYSNATGGTSTIAISGTGTQNVSLCNKLALKFPQNNETVMPQSIKLAWESSPLPNSQYELIVTDNSNNIVYSSNSITDTYYQFATGLLLYEQIYHWKVRALVNNTAATEWSDIRQFTVKPETPVVPNFGSALGHFNDAIIYKNNNNYTGYWQCVEYVKRYQNVVYGLSMPAIGNADAYFLSTQLGFGRFANGCNFIPQVGDLVCLLGGENGHVAIIRNVEFSNDGNNNNDFVYIAQQNVGSNQGQHLSQQVRLTYNNGAFTISNFVGKTVQGWRRALPTITLPLNNQVFQTTEPLIDWEPHPNAQSYYIAASKRNPMTGCYEPIPSFNGVTIYQDYYNFEPGVLQAGEKYRLRVGVTTAFGGYLTTEPVYFEIAPNASSQPSYAGNSYINTKKLTTLKNGKTITAPVSNILIQQKRNGFLFDKGFSDESGNIFIETTPALISYDTIIASGQGVIPQTIVLSDDMIANNNVEIVLLPSPTNYIINPRVEILNNVPIFTQNVVNLRIKAENHTGYKIIDFANSSDSMTTYFNYNANDTLITFTIPKIGNNPIHVRFIGADTIDVIKTVFYDPTPAPSNFNTVTIIADNNSLNTKIFVNGIFVKTITSNQETIDLPLGYQQFSFIKENYISFFTSTYTTETIYLSMEQVIITNLNNITIEPKIKIYPNPTPNGRVILLCEQVPSSKIIVNIYNVRGQKIQTNILKTANNQAQIELDLGEQNKGMYFIQLWINDKSYMHKIIIN